MLKNDYGINKDSDESKFAEMASIYCPPNSYNWEHYLATPIYNELKENGYYSRASEEVQKRANNKTKKSTRNITRSITILCSVSMDNDINTSIIHESSTSSRNIYTIMWYRNIYNHIYMYCIYN